MERQFFLNYWRIFLKKSIQNMRKQDTYLNYYYLTLHCMKSVQIQENTDQK